MGKKKGGRSFGVMILIVLFFLSGITIYVFGSTQQPISNTSMPLTTSPPRIRVESKPPILTPAFETLDVQNQTSILLPDSPLLNNNGMYQVHFIHIPKCGGTSMTTVLREMMCSVDPISNKDCCTNPGFCEFSAGRRCSVIKGCINHFPNRSGPLLFLSLLLLTPALNRPFIYKKMPTVTIMREPTSRSSFLLSVSPTPSTLWQTGLCLVLSRS
jgi:hypothetical protein